MAACPKCGKENTEPASEWFGHGSSPKKMQIQRLVCTNCGTSYVSWIDKTGKHKVMTRKG